MNDVLSSEIKRIDKAFDKIEKERPALTSIAEVFRGLLVSRATIRARIPYRQDPPLPSPDPDKQSAGVPVLTEENLADLMDPWGETVALTVAPLAKAFPKIEAELLRLSAALDRGDADLGQCMRALMKGDDAQLDATALRLGLRQPVLRFLLGQMLKPFVEKRVEPLRAAVRKLPWHKGYCPVCGSMPEITFLQEEGQRWLRCSLCGHEWQFNRMVCPYCEVQQSKKKEIITIKGRRHEFAELCSSCRKYLVGIDLRETGEESITAASAVGLVHLDLIAQEKGYSPVALCAWNMVADDEQDRPGE